MYIPFYCLFLFFAILVCFLSNGLFIANRRLLCVWRSLSRFLVGIAYWPDVFCDIQENRLRKTLACAHYECQDQNALTPKRYHTICCSLSRSVSLTRNYIQLCKAFTLANCKLLVSPWICAKNNLLLHMEPFDYLAL